MTVTTCDTLPYPVHVGRGLLSTLPALVPALARAHRIAVVTDETVGPRYAARIAQSLGEDRCLLVSLPPGEAQKTRETWARVTDALLDARFGRDSLLIALGGGVVGDLTGFVAATYLRGVPLLQPAAGRRSPCCLRARHGRHQGRSRPPNWASRSGPIRPECSRHRWLG